MAQIDHELATALRHARSTVMNFALVLKGPEDGTLIVSRHPITPKTIAERRPDLHGCHVFKGRCVGNEHDHMVFETTEEPPGTLAKTLRLLISRDAGLALHVETRKVGDHGDADARPETKPNGAPAPTHQEDRGAELEKESVRKRLVALAVPYQQVAVGDGPDAQRLHTLFGAIKAFVDKHDYARASQGLDVMERLLVHGQTAQSDAAGPSDATPIASTDQD